MKTVYIENIRLVLGLIPTPAFMNETVYLSLLLKLFLFSTPLINSRTTHMPVYNKIE
jgi:hypothetical protein